MSKQNELLKALRLHIKNAHGSGINSVVQLPIEIALSIQSMLQKQHSALKSVDEFVDEINNNFNKENSSVLIHHETIKMNQVIIKSALT